MVDAGSGSKPPRVRDFKSCKVTLVRRMTRLLGNPCPLLLQTMATGATGARGGREVMEHGVEDVEEKEVISPRHRGVSSVPTLSQSIHGRQRHIGSETVAVPLALQAGRAQHQV